MPHFLKVHAALFTVALLFSTNYVVAKWIMPVYLMPFGIIVLRVWGSTLLFSVCHYFWVREKTPTRRDLAYMALCSLFGIVANQLMFFKGLSLTSPINTAILMTLSPIIILTVAVVLRKENLTFVKSLGILLGALGAFLLISGGRLTWPNENNWGSFFLLMNATTYSIYLVLIKPLMKKYHALTVTKWVFTFGCVGVLPFGWFELVNGHWAEMPLWGYGILLFTIVGGTFFTYLLNAWGLAYVNASLVGFYIYLQPVLTSMIAIFYQQDELTWAKVFYSLLIFAGVYLVSVRK
jgi:drug/metabolite transporter (DMT)-like permease